MGALEYRVQKSKISNPKLYRLVSSFQNPINYQKSAFSKSKSTITDMTSTSATVKRAIDKWKSVAKNSSQRTVNSSDETAVDSTYSKSFRSFDDMSSDADELSSSVTTSSSVR